MDKRKTNRKWIFIVVGVIVVVVLFFVIANFIVVDDCASSCPKSASKYCPSVCAQKTLLDVILGGDR